MYDYTIILFMQLQDFLKSLKPDLTSASEKKICQAYGKLGQFMQDEASGRFNSCILLSV